MFAITVIYALKLALTQPGESGSMMKGYTMSMQQLQAWVNHYYALLNNPELDNRTRQLVNERLVCALDLLMVAGDN